MAKIERVNKSEISIFWFRRDLRFIDNVGLWEALQSGTPVLPIFIFDTEILEKLPSKEDKRVCFIHDSILNLQHALVANGSSLLVMQGRPEEVFERLVEHYQIKEVYANRDYEPLAQARDKNIDDLLARHTITFKTFKDQVIFEKAEVVKEDGTPYLIFTPYSKAWKQKLFMEGIASFPSESLLYHLHKTKPLPIPSIEDLGFVTTKYETSPTILNEEIIRTYHLSRNIPSLLGTSNLSVHLRFGTMSIRSLVKAALTLNEQWLNELIWREFFMAILYHFPRVVNSSFKPKYDFIEWRNNEQEFYAWCEGRTGYPLVDAGMRELNQTGFMHNRVRMVVASFLTKHLLIDWRWGEAYFADKLLDYELSSNPVLYSSAAHLTNAQAVEYHCL